MSMRLNARALTLGLAVLGFVSGCAEDHRWRSAMTEGTNAMRSGDYTHAEESFVAARKEAEVLDPQGKRLAETLSQLGEVNRELARYPRAEALFQEALAIRERVYGPAHAETAASLTDLGELYRRQGLYTQAEALHQRAREIREKVFGADHSKTAESLNNIAVVYQDQHRFSDAEPVLQQIGRASCRERV